MPPYAPFKIERVSPFQILAVMVCVLINLVDGFDLLAMAYVAPVIREAWSISAPVLGIIFSSFFVGLAVGAVALAPLSDYVGRRRVMLVGTFCMGLIMFLCAIVHSTPQLIACRFATGMCMGAILPAITVMAGEYVPEKYKNFAISSVHMANPVGSIVGGACAVYLLESYNWQAVFFAGGVLTVLAAVVAFFLLPESLEFLFSRPDASSLNKVNAILRKMKQPAVTTLPPTMETEESVGIKSLLHGDNAKWSLLLWLSFFLVLFAFYFINTWLPQVMVEAGLSLDRAIYISVINSGGALIGITLVGIYSVRFGLRPVLNFFMLAGAGFMVLFGYSPTHVVLLGVLALIIGAFTGGSVVGLYTCAFRLYDTRARATGVGWGIGIGRLGGILSPTVAGLFIGMGLSRGLNFAIFAVSFVISAVAISSIRTRRLSKN